MLNLWLAGHLVMAHFPGKRTLLSSYPWGHFHQVTTVLLKKVCGSSGTVV